MEAVGEMLATRSTTHTPLIDVAIITAADHTVKKKVYRGNIQIRSNNGETRIRERGREHPTAYHKIPSFLPSHTWLRDRLIQV